MSDTDEIIIQPMPYGWAKKDKRLGIVLISIVALLLCAVIYPHWDIDYESHESPNEPTTQVSQISNHADIVITATPAYSAPSE